MRKVQQGFVAGEFSPQMFGRFDDTKYAQGLALCRNFITLPQGPATVRPGFAFVNRVKYADRPTRIIPFTWSLEQTMVIELGDHYARFHTAGQTLLSDNGQPYEIETPYAAEDVFDIHFVQSMDVMTLVHPKYPPQELRRYGATDWRISEISFTSSLTPPDAPSCEFKVVAGEGVKITDEEKTRYTLKYKPDAGTDESEAGPIGSCEGNLYLNNATVTLTWEAVPGADRYRIYKGYKGLFCYIGETAETTFIDDNYEPDAGITPPIYDDPFGLSKGITRVTVVNGGAGYKNGAIAPLSMDLFTEDTVEEVVDGTKDQMFDYSVSGVGMPSGDTQIAAQNGWPCVVSRGTYATVSVQIVDLEGVGGGAEVSVETIQESINHENEGSNTRYYFCGIRSITLTNSGQNYRKPAAKIRFSNIHYDFASTTVEGTFPLNLMSDATINVSDPTGSGAVLVPVIRDGEIASVAVRSTGQNYSDPTLTVMSPNGSGAQLTAHVSNGDYPSAVAYFEQRRCFGGTEEKPQTIWMTRSGTESDMSYTIPSQDDNRIRFRLAAQEASRILHMVPLSHLILLTNSTEYRAASGITPSDIDVKPQSYIGASNVQPVLVNSTMVYASARDGHIRELGYNWQSSGFTTGDLSVRATHLVEADRPVDMGLQKSPDPIVWIVMRSGTLIGLTYMPEQSVAGWHKHVTVNGAFESVAVVSEGNEDVVYCVVRREINGKTVRYIERMHERLVSSLDESFFVDCGGTYRGEPTKEISGLHWLEGETVSVLADGCVLPKRVVKDGKISISMAASVVHVGLPITADLQTLPVAAQTSDGSYYQGHMKNINEAWVRVYQSSGLFVGPDFDHLMEAKQRTTEPYGSPPDLMNREVSVVTAPAWTDSGQICIRQADPLPLTLISVSFELAE